MNIISKKLFRIFLLLIILVKLISLTNSSVIALDFDFSQHSFDIEEKGYYRLKVKIPESYNFSPEAEEYYQDNKLIMYRDNDKLAINEDFSYQINLSGYEFLGEGIYLTKEGLYLKEISIDLEDKTAKRLHYDGRTIDVEGQDNRIVFEDVKISADENQIIGEYSSKQNYYLKFGDWIVEAEESILTEEKIELYGSTRIKSLYLDLELPIKAMKLNSELKGDEVKIKDFNFSLFSGTELEVDKSELTTDGWKIEQANLVSEGENHSLITEMGDFYINPNAAFRKRENYYSKQSNFNYYDQQYQIPQNKLSLSSNRILIDEIQREIENNNLKQELSIGPIRIAEDTYEEIPYITAKISGVEFEAINGYRKEEKFFFSTGLLYLMVADKPIVINLTEISYGRDGLDFEEAIVKADDFNYLDYGLVNYTGIKVEEEAFNLEGEFHLAEDFLGEEIKFEIEEFIIDKAGLVSNIQLVDLIDKREIEIKGWDVELSELVINDLLEFTGKLKLPEIEQFKLPETMEIDKLALDNTAELVEISAQGENRDELELTEEYKLDLRDLKIEEKDILDEIKVYFTGAALHLPDYYTGGYIWLEEINFDSEGNIYYNETPLDEWFEDYQNILWQEFN